MTSDVTVIAGLPQASIAVPAFATPIAYVGGPVNLGAVGQDQAFDESDLTYTWSTVAEPAKAVSPKFSRNGTNASKLTAVTFATPGTYTFRVTVLNPFYQPATSDVTVVVGPRRTITTKSTGGKRVRSI